jgi:hypothetical protein
VPLPWRSPGSVEHKGTPADHDWRRLSVLDSVRSCYIRAMALLLASVASLVVLIVVGLYLIR